MIDIGDIVYWNSYKLNVYKLHIKFRLHINDFHENETEILYVTDNRVKSKISILNTSRIYITYTDGFEYQDNFYKICKKF